MVTHSTGKTVKRDVLRLLKTKEGFLHRDIDEGLYLEDDELNYGFTDDPFEAYRFYSYPNNAPKYLGIDTSKPIKTEEDCCEYLNGEIVEIEVVTTIEWKFI